MVIDLEIKLPTRSLLACSKMAVLPWRLLPCSPAVMLGEILKLSVFCISRMILLLLHRCHLSSEF